MGQEPGVRDITTPQHTTLPRHSHTRLDILAGMADIESAHKPHSVDGRPLGPDGRPLPGPAQMQQIMAQKRMAQQQAQKLNELDEKADALQDGASQFEKSAGKLKNKFWMENLKTIIACAVVGLFVLGLIYWKFFSTPEPTHYNGQYGPGQGGPNHQRTGDFQP